MKKLQWIVSIEVAILTIIGTFLIQGGDDLLRFYYPFVKGCLECGFTPFYSQWSLSILQLFPVNLVYPIWTIITIVITLIVCYVNDVNPLIIICAFPFFGQIWLGQIDIILVIGFSLMLAKNDLLKSIGIFLILTKPQIAALPLLFFIIHNRNWRIYILPFTLIFCSFIVYGFLWPLEWLAISKNLPVHQWRIASMDIWLIGLLFIWIPFYKNSFKDTILFSFLANPFVSVYSYFIPMLFQKNLKWWLIPLSYSWLLLYPFMGISAMRFAWIIPVSIAFLSLFDKREIEKC